jgi:hypothetical protein
MPTASLVQLCPVQRACGLVARPSVGSIVPVCGASSYGAAAASFAGWDRSSRLATVQRLDSGCFRFLHSLTAHRLDVGRAHFAHSCILSQVLLDLVAALSCACMSRLCVAGEAANESRSNCEAGRSDQGRRWERVIVPGEGSLGREVSACSRRNWGSAIASTPRSH